MANKMTASKAAKVVEPKIDSTTGLVPVVGTKKSKHLDTDKVYHVSKQLAETLVKKGSANYK